MAKITPKTSITARGVDSARSRAAAGEEGEIKDAACRGLTLRIRGGKVAWTIRWMLRGKYRRWTIGGPTTPPDVARDRANFVKASCREGIDPSQKVVFWLTGATPSEQRAAAAQRGPKSISWDAAKTLFLDHIQRTRRPATYDDYRGILRTPEKRR